MPRALVSLLLLPVLAACGGGEGGGAPRTPAASATTPAADCAAADTTPVMAAVLAYITTVEPRPARFLTAAGSDSAVPDDGLRVLQDKGPTFFYAGSEAAIAKLKEKLERDGPWVSMLVLYRGRTEQADGSVQVRLGGRYVANADDGKPATERTVVVRCVEGTWRVQSGDRGTPTAALAFPSRGVPST